VDTTQVSYVDAVAVGIQPPHFRLPDASHVGTVSLAVSNLANSIAFYCDVIGLAVVKQEAEHAELGVGDTALMKLFELPGVQPIGRRQRLGLYHTAFLLPSRAALGSFIEHLHRQGVYFGAGDHLYSEALYLVDPDGLSVEVYADRPRELWQVRGQELLSATGTVDIAGVVAASNVEWKGAPSGTTVGHVHLYVGDLGKARRFYHEALGFAVMTWSYPGALFIAAGGYHHHVGLNVWAAGSPQAAPTDARLLSWELVVPVAADIANIHQNLERLGWTSSPGMDGTLLATDPWGITVHVVC
jgi:catechol 2,3-dioxygenase